MVGLSKLTALLSRHLANIIGSRLAQAHLPVQPYHPFRFGGIAGAHSYRDMRGHAFDWVGVVHMFGPLPRRHGNPPCHLQGHPGQGRVKDALG